MSFSKDQTKLGYSRKLSKNEMLSDGILLQSQKCNSVDESKPTPSTNGFNRITNKAY